MKSCPTCQRTFEDTFTFCLVDGSILSPPSDLRATLIIPESRETELPPTEAFLKSKEETRPAIQAPLASPQPPQRMRESIPTITAPAGQVELLGHSPSHARSSRKSNRSALMLGVGALMLIGIVFFILANRANNTTGVSNQANANATPNQTPLPVTAINLEGTVWKGTQNGEYLRIYEFKAGGVVVETVGWKVESSSLDKITGSWTLRGNQVSMKFPATGNYIPSEVEATIQGNDFNEMTGKVFWSESGSAATISVKRTR